MSGGSDGAGPVPWQRLRPAARPRSRCGRSRVATARPGRRSARATPRGCASGRRPGRPDDDAPLGDVPRDGPRPAPAGPAGPVPAARAARRRRVRRPGDGEQHRRRVGEVRQRRLLDRPAARRPAATMPVAVALAVDHCLFGLGLHRIEIAIRPGEHRLAAGRREARASPRSATRLGTCTSTGTGGTTGSSR